MMRKMTIAVLRSNDARQRYRFVSEPLVSRGHYVTLLDATSFVRLLRGLIRFVAAGERPDAIVATGAGPKDVVVFHCARWFGIPFIARWGGNAVADTRAQLRAAIAAKRPRAALVSFIRHRTAWYMTARVEDFIVVNPNIRSEIAPHTGPGARMSVIPQFSVGRPVAHDHDIPGIPCLLTVSNLNYKRKARGVIWLIDAVAAYARSASHPISFRILGGGIHLRDILRHIESTSLPTQLSVDVAGFVDDPVPEYISADIFLYHSDHDGTPNVLLEAKRFGLPTLLNDYPAFRDIASDGISALFYGDREEFGCLLSRMIDDRSLREQLALAAQREYSEQYTIAAVAAPLEEALSAAIVGQKSGNKSQCE